MHVRGAAAALVLAVGLGLLTACVTTQTCVSWHFYDSEQELFDDAGLVVTGTAEPTGTTREVIGVSMPVYRLDVTETLKGDATEPLEVTPAPLTCMGGESEYPDGIDPFATDAESVFFLVRDGGSWRAMTPIQGVLPLPDDGMLPFDAGDR